MCKIIIIEDDNYNNYYLLYYYVVLGYSQLQSQVAVRVSRLLVRVSMLHQQLFSSRIKRGSVAFVYVD